MDGSTRSTTLDVRMAQRSALGLLAAMAAALFAGLLAWGPIVLADAPHAGRIAGGLEAAIALAPAAIALVALPALRRARWPAPLARPWQHAFGLALPTALLGFVQHVDPSTAGRVLVALGMAGVAQALLLAALAERADCRFGARSACIVAAWLLPMLGAGWALLAHALWGRADLRALLWLQALPLLLLPAGVPRLPGRRTSAADWGIGLGLCALALAAELLDGAILAATGIGGRALMHLALAAAAGRFAYRLLAASGAWPSQRRSSLNASG